MSGQPVSVLLSRSLLVTVHDGFPEEHERVPIVILEVPPLLLGPVVSRALLPYATDAHVHSWVTLQEDGAFEFAAFITVPLPVPVVLPVSSGCDILGVSDDGEARTVLPPDMSGLQRVDRLMIGNHSDFDAETATRFFAEKERCGSFIVGLGISVPHPEEGLLLNPRWFARKQYFDSGNFPGCVEVTRRFSAECAQVS